MEEYLSVVNTKESYDCYCLCCDSRIEQPAITGGFCWKCFETNED